MSILSSERQWGDVEPLWEMTVNACMKVPVSDAVFVRLLLKTNSLSPNFG